LGGGVSTARQQAEHVTAAIRRERDKCEARMRAYGEQCRHAGIAEGVRRLQPQIDELRAEIQRLSLKSARYELEIAAMRPAFEREDTERIDRSGNSG
jgi:hypothetical protein